MKAIPTFILALFLINFALPAQVKKTITIKAGTRIIDYFPFNERYRYTEFLDGKVLFKDSTFFAAKLNYNILLGEMQYIPKKDTFAFANPKEIDYVEIGQDTFYYDNGYLEVLYGHDPAIMTVKQYIKFVDFTKEAGYGMQSSTGGINSYSSMFGASGTTVQKLNLKEDIVLTRNTEYYLGNNKNGFLLYRKKTLLKSFPQYKTTIESYLKENHINFKAKDDLLKLTVFLDGII